MKKVFRNPLLLLSVITISIICIFWGKIIFHPNAYLLSIGGDAYKNYYTPSWFIANDNGTHFTGMNYPYGEHVVFTDNQPMISWIANFVDNNLFSISGYTVAIINLLLFISLFFCVFLLYKIIRHYGLPIFYAIAAAILIGLMNPQIDRFWGHFALGYSMFMPLIWYLLILIKSYNYNIWRLGLLIATIICFGFIHMYYVLLASLFILFHVIVLLFKKKKTITPFLSLLCAGLIPLIFITVFMKLTDHVSDRPESPYGFFRYKASFQSVFLPMNGTIKNQVVKIFNLGQSNSEGFAYVGIIGLVFLFILLFIFIKRLIFKKSFRNSFINLPGDLGVYLAAAVLMLLFSMTLPFSLGLEFLLDIITPLKQFRSPGRFAWGFYFVYTVALSVIIYLLFKKIQKTRPVIAYLFIIIIFGVQVGDTYGYFGTTAKRMQQNNAENPFLHSNTYFSSVIEGTTYKHEDFDAILFLPSFFQGSEKLYIDRTGSSFTHAMQISYQTGLPLVNQMMSRTSYSQTLNNVQIVSNPNIPNNSKSGVFTAKHLLLVSVDKPLKSGEKYLVDNATLFATKERFSFYDLNLEILDKKGEAYASAEMNAIKDSLKEFEYSGGKYFSQDLLNIFYRNSFEEKSTAEPFLGGGSFLSDGKKLLMAEIPVNIEDTIWIEVSFWAKSTTKTMAYPYIEIDFLNDYGEIIKIGSVAPTLTTDVLRSWVRAAEDFELPPSIKKIRITCSDDSEVNFDELLVRHTAYNVYYDMTDSSHFIVNNFPIGE